MPAMSLPLEGIRVIDVAEHGFVPTAATVLAEYGADVIKVERLDGDPNRKIIPSGMVATKDGVDYLAEIFNRDKRDIALDITSDAGYRVLARLIEAADVFATNQLPQVQRKLRTTADEVMAINPRIVYARGHGQGQFGPDTELGSYDSVAYWSRGGAGHVLSTPGAVPADAAACARRRAVGYVPGRGDLRRAGARRPHRQGRHRRRVPARQRDLDPGSILAKLILKGERRASVGADLR